MTYWATEHSKLGSISAVLPQWPTEERARQAKGVTAKSITAKGVTAKAWVLLRETCRSKRTVSG